MSYFFNLKNIHHGVLAMLIVFLNLSWNTLAIAEANLSAAAMPPTATFPIAKQGVLEAKNWQYNGQKLLLTGEWQVIWGQLIEPQNFNAHYKGAYFALPQNWDEVQHPLMNGANGVATFRLKLNIPDHKNDLSILVVSPNSAWKFYLDGQLVGQNGIVSQRLDEYETHYIPRTLKAKSGTSEIVLQVANFSNAHGGVEYAMALWDAKELKQFQDLMSLFFALALGILLSIGLIHLVFYLADRKHNDQGPVHLWFSLLCFLLVIRIFGVIPFFHTYTPDFIYWSSLLLPYFTLFAAPGVYLLFFRAAFPQQFPNKLTLYIIWLCLVLALLTLIVPESVYTSTKNYAIALNVLVIIYSMIFTVMAIKDKQAGAWAILISNFLFFLAALNARVRSKTFSSSSTLSNSSFSDVSLAA